MKPLFKTYVEIYSDFSGGRIDFDLIGSRKFLRVMVKFPDMQMDVVDRHTKGRFWEQYACPCDRFKRCHLSIADYKTFHNKKLFQDISIKELYERLMEIWEKDNGNKAG